VCLAVQAEGSPGAESALRAREQALLPVYHQVALQFAQVHGGGAGRRGCDQGWWSSSWCFNQMLH
jgi:hypothetical protein